MQLPIVNVAVAILQRSDGHVLLAERPRGKVSAGYWEFPGGKFEVGEQAEQALARELREEVGVELDRGYPWLVYEHAYADKIVRLHFYHVVAWHGAPHGREGQRVSWEDPAAVKVGPLLPANDRVLRALNLPSVYAVTQAEKLGVAGFMPQLQAALDRGVRLIQVHERAMALEQLAQFARRVVMLARRYNAIVLVNSDESLARRVGADGVHVSAARLKVLIRPPSMRVWAASCHTSEDLTRAVNLGAHFAVLSHISAIQNQADVSRFEGVDLRKRVRAWPLPVYGMDGLRLDRVETAMRQGVHGGAKASVKAHS